MLAEGTIVLVLLVSLQRVGRRGRGDVGRSGSRSRSGDSSSSGGGSSGLLLALGSCSDRLPSDTFRLHGGRRPNAPWRGAGRSGVSHLVTVETLHLAGVGALLRVGSGGSSAGCRASLHRTFYGGLRRMSRSGLVTRDKSSGTFRPIGLRVSQSPVVELPTKLGDERVRAISRLETCRCSSAYTSLVAGASVSVRRRDNPDDGRVKDMFGDVDPLGE